MNIQKDCNLVVTITTPGSVLSRRVSLGGQDINRNSSSPNYSDYSDSFAQDSPINILTPKKRAKYNGKIKSYKSAIFYHKSKINVRGLSRTIKPNETTQKLMEANQIKINELMSENADCNRQLLEKINEVKTLENQNKIQERYLKKSNSRDADIPSIISKYNSQVHSLQELLRRNKEKLDLSEKQRRNLEIDLHKAKIRIDRLSAICENNQLIEKNDLSKKLQVVTDLLEAEQKKGKEIERNIELLTKKHNHELSVEARKYKELNQIYKDVLIDLKDVKDLLKEKTKMLEMQNIYSKVTIKPPHHLSTVNNEMGDCENYNSPIANKRVIISNKIVTLKEYKEQSKINCTKRISKVARPSILKKTVKTKDTLMEAEKQEDLNSMKVKENVLYYGDTASETSEVEEKSEKNDRFSDLHQLVLKNLQNSQNEDSERIKKNELLAKLKYIDQNYEYSPEDNDSVKKITDKTVNYNENDLDVFCSSDSDNDYSDQKSSIPSPKAFIPQGPAALMGSRRNADYHQRTNLSNHDFFGFSLKNNSDYNLNKCKMVENDDESVPDCEQINID